MGSIQQYHSDQQIHQSETSSQQTVINSGQNYTVIPPDVMDEEMIPKKFWFSYLRIKFIYLRVFKNVSHSFQFQFSLTV